MCLYQPCQRSLLPSYSRAVLLSLPLTPSIPSLLLPRCASFPPIALSGCCRFEEAQQGGQLAEEDVEERLARLPPAIWGRLYK